MNPGRIDTHTHFLGELTDMRNDVRDYAQFQNSETLFEKKLYHGAALYPELWSDEVLEQDIRYMKEAGINVVRRRI